MMTNGYKCFWNGKELDVYADTTYQAQQIATEKFQKISRRRTVKDYDVTVVLCELNGEQYTHSGEIPC